jgi:SSS family solute:Na+ symporter
MSIAAANLFTRNIYTEYMNRDATPAQEARVSRLASLVVKAGAVVVILLLDPQFSIDLQLIGGVIILQTLPAVAIGLYTRALHAWGADRGLGVGLVAGLYMLYRHAERRHGQGALRRRAVRAVALRARHQGDRLHGVDRARVNLLVTFVVTLFVRGRELPDQTEPADYELEAGDPASSRWAWTRRRRPRRPHRRPASAGRGTPPACSCRCRRRGCRDG